MWNVECTWTDQEQRQPEVQQRRIRLLQYYEISYILFRVSFVWYNRDLLGPEARKAYWSIIIRLRKMMVLLLKLSWPVALPRKRQLRTVPCQPGQAVRAGICTGDRSMPFFVLQDSSTRYINRTIPRTTVPLIVFSNVLAQYTLDKTRFDCTRVWYSNKFAQYSLCPIILIPLDPLIRKTSGILPKLHAICIELK